MATVCKGKINIWYRLPKVATVPKQICYTFPGSSEVCVTGESYEMTSPTHQGGQCNTVPKDYKIYGYINATAIPNYGTTSRVQNVYLTYGSNFTGPIYSIAWDSGNFNTGTPHPQIRVSYGPWNNILFYVDTYPTYGYTFNSPPYGWYVVRNDGTNLATDITQCGALSTTITIKNSLGVVIHTASGSGTPTVRTIDASSYCTLNNSQWQFGKSINTNQEITLIEKKSIGAFGVKCKQIQQLSNTFYIGVPLIEKCSPSNCDLYPEYKTIGGCTNKYKAKKPDCENNTGFLGSLLSNQLCTTECNSDIFYVHVLRKGSSREVVYPVNVRDVKGFKGIAQCVLVKTTKRGWKIVVQTLNLSKSPVQTSDIISVDECPLTSKFRITCGANKPKTNCPPETCYECIDGNYTCCYDKDLRLIKTIKR